MKKILIYLISFLASCGPVAAQHIGTIAETQTQIDTIVFQNSLRQITGARLNYLLKNISTSYVNRLADTLLLLPQPIGTAGKALVSNGTGLKPSWETVGGGGGTPAGSNTEIQWNDGGTDFGASSDFYWDNSGTKTFFAGAAAVVLGDYGNKAHLIVDGDNNLFSFNFSNADFGSCCTGSLTAGVDALLLSAWVNGDSSYNYPLKFSAEPSGKYIGFIAPDTITKERLIVLPNGNPTAGQVLSVDSYNNTEGWDGSGRIHTEWVTPSGGSGLNPDGSDVGATSQVQEFTNGMQSNSGLITIFKNSSTDDLKLNFDGQNFGSAGIKTYGNITTAITSNAVGAEVGQILFKTIYAGSQVNPLTIDGNAVTLNAIAGMTVTTTGAFYNLGQTQFTINAGGDINNPDIGFREAEDGDYRNGIYRIDDNNIGFAIKHALVGGFNATGLFTDNITEQTSTNGVLITGDKLQVDNAGHTAIIKINGQDGYTGDILPGDTIHVVGGIIVGVN